MERIDLLIATHPHADHIGGLIDVLKALPVDRVATNGQMHTTLTYEHFLDAIADSGAYYTEVRRGDTLSLGALSLVVLHPAEPTGTDLNNQSVVLRLDHGDVSFLFAADAEHEAEASMLAAQCALRADILKVGHHGSRTASSPEFLAAVRPSVAVYSAGAGNPYGHPHVETLEALAAAGAEVYGTDVHGTIIVVSDGVSYHVDTQRQGSPRAPPVTAPATAPAPAGSSGPTTYTVQPGDSVSRIASRFGVSVAALAAANGIADPGLIRVGEVLIIPSQGDVAPEPGAPPAPATRAPAPPVQPTATLQATATSAPEAVPQPPTLEVVSLTSPVAPGADAALTVRTAPGAACNITVYYKSGASQAAGLDPLNADAQGLATWRWKVGTRTTPGVWRIVVSCAVNGKPSTLEIPFEVR